MRRLRPLAPLLRLAGVAPDRVLALAVAMRAEARGQQALQYEARGRRGLHPETGRILLLVVLGVLSLAVAAGVGAWRDRLLLATTLLVIAQASAALLRAAGEVVPLVLGTDDRRVLGWWPVTERELLVARGVLILAVVFEASGAMLAVPLMVLLVVGAPPLVPLLGALAGLTLHAAALAAAMLLAVHGLGRLLGRRRARRVVELLGTFLLVIGLNVAVRAIRPLGEQLHALPGWWPLVAPPAWYGAWGAFAQATWPQVAGAGASILATGFLVMVGTRALGRLAAGDEEGPAPAARRARRDWTRPVMAWIAPWLPGRDGRALRLLLRAHLREDWRFTGALVFLPVVMLVYLLVVRADTLGEIGRGLGGGGAAAAMLSLWMSLLGLSLGGAVVCSTEAPASWLAHGGVLTPERALSLQRRLVRCLVPLPMLTVAVAGLVWRAGLAPRDVPLAVAPAWLAFEIMLVFVQAVAPAASFSRAWRREGHEFRGFHLFVVLVWPLAMLPVFLFYDHRPWGTAAVLLGQVAVLLVLRGLLRRRVRRLGVYGVSPHRA